MDGIDVKQADVLADRRGGNVIVGMVELEGPQCFVLHVVAESHIEAPRTGEASGCAAAATEKFRQSVFLEVHKRLYYRAYEVGFCRAGASLPDNVRLAAASEDCVFQALSASLGRAPAIVESQAGTAKAANEIRAVRKAQLVLPNSEYLPTASA